MWDKIYYTSIHKTNNPRDYFITELNEKNSYGSKEDISKTDKNLDTIINYINFYKFCSKIIILSDGDLKLIKKQNKNTLKFVI